MMARIDAKGTIRSLGWKAGGPIVEIGPLCSGGAACTWTTEGLSVPQNRVTDEGAEDARAVSYAKHTHLLLQRSGSLSRTGE